MRDEIMDDEIGGGAILPRPSENITHLEWVTLSVLSWKQLQRALEASSSWEQTMIGAPLCSVTVRHGPAVSALKTAASSHLKETKSGRSIQSINLFSKRMRNGDII